MKLECRFSKRSHEKERLFALVFGLISLTTMAAVTSIEEPDNIKRAVEQFVSAELKGGHHPTSANEEQRARTMDTPIITVGPLDPRLRLPKCPEALDISRKSDASGPLHQRVLVRCHAARPWTLYVPVTVKMSQEVLVAKYDLRPGQPLRAADVTRKTMPVDGFRRSYLDTLALSDGLTPRRPIAAGSPLSRSDLQAVRLIKRGSKVRLINQGHGIKIQAQGIALDNGAKGERIAVKNERSNRIVYGTVRADGQVAVN